MTTPTDAELAAQEAAKSNARALAGGYDFQDEHLAQVDAIAQALLDGTLPGDPA